MSFQFHVGQRVVCVTNAPNKAGGLTPRYWDTKLPVVGGVYTYRQKHGRDPKVADVTQAFRVSRTTAWRRLRSAS